MFEALLGGARKVVSRILRRDYNYRIAYGKVDLEKDYWSIVGAVSAEEWAALGVKKRELLVAHGLTPSSRVLDVGCGTGQLAAALEDYLSLVRCTSGRTSPRRRSPSVRGSSGSRTFALPGTR